MSNKALCYKEYMIDDGEVVDECEHCGQQEVDHCRNMYCNVCPMEIHECLELEGIVYDLWICEYEGTLDE